MKARGCLVCGAEMARAYGSAVCTCPFCGSIFLPLGGRLYGERDRIRAGIERLLEGGSKRLDGAHLGGGVAIAEALNGVGDALKTLSATLKAVGNGMEGGGVGIGLGGRRHEQTETQQRKTANEQLS